MKNRSAFTLVEMLLVVALIALLISILLPSLGRSREMARRAMCLSNQNQIMNGGLSYAAENQRSFGPFVTYGWEYQLQNGVGAEAFEKHCSGPNVYYCPSRSSIALFGTPTQQWNWRTDLMPIYGNGQIEHLVDYWLYFLAGRHSNRVIAIKTQRVNSVPLNATSLGEVTTTTCWGEGRGVTGSYAGKTYPSMHGPEGLPSSFLDGHAAWVERKQLIYDGRPNHEILRARQRPYIGQEANPQPGSTPLP